VGSRCRAKWMDGNLYDATVQKIPGDGTVVVNWLRPRPTGPADSSPPGRKLLTVSEAGGDDSMYRIVMQEDVQPLDMEPRSPETKDALRLFGSRGPMDLLCVDCGSEGASWASISFGTYLCSACAQEHQKLGVRWSLVKELNDGWGWDRHELQYLSHGGNAAFLAKRKPFAMMKHMPIAKVYVTRFSEQYRRTMDALVVGSLAPPPVAEEVASQPASAGDFLSSAEAAAVVRELLQCLEDAAQSMLSSFSSRSSGLRPIAPPPRTMQPGKLSKITAC